MAPRGCHGSAACPSWGFPWTHRKWPLIRGSCFSFWGRAGFWEKLLLLLRPGIRGRLLCQPSQPIVVRRPGRILLPSPRYNPRATLAATAAAWPLAPPCQVPLHSIPTGHKRMGTRRAESESQAFAPGLLSSLQGLVLAQPRKPGWGCRCTAP